MFLQYSNVILLLGISVTPLLLMAFIKNKRNNGVNNEDTKSYFRCTFLSQGNNGCRKHLIRNYVCSKDCSSHYLNDLRAFLETAKTSISMCVYTITLDLVYEVLSNAHKNSIKVRVITDREMSGCYGSIVKRLKNEGVPVKMQTSDGSLMHHKFCLIDENDEKSAQVFFGSTNLTIQALCSNWDQIIYTNKLPIIQRFSEEFELLWQEL